MAALGNPQDTLRCIHIAGTNGKGAVAAMLDSVLRAAGYRVARYTSPHLVAINERFFIGGEPVTDDALASAADEVLPVIARMERDQGLEVTFFEALTAVAFVLFARAHPDVTVLETGLGGRLDATNIIASPLVSVITRIGLDHCDWLGATHAAIATEKAGIVKPGCPVVCGAMPPEALDAIRRVAAENGSPLTVAQPWTPPAGFALFGAFQEENAATVKSVLDMLPFTIPDGAISDGLARVVWPGRCQRVAKDGVTYIVDGAHNPDGATALARVLGGMAPVGLVAGFCGDKDVAGHLHTLAPHVARAWAVPIRNDRSLAPDDVVARMGTAGIADATPCATVPEALSAAAAWARETGNSVVVCGSLFLVGEALVALDAYPWRLHSPDANELLAPLP
jgi:dihydrofolate synthase/folylpolyglutamate synthase